MKNQHTNLKTITCAVVMLIITIATVLNAQNSQSTNKNDKQPVKVLNGKVLPSDFDLSILKSQSIESVNVIKPDSINEVADLIVKYGEDARFGVILIKTKEKKIVDGSLKSNVDTDEKIYSVIEHNPVFPGGEIEMLKFISRNIKYPIKAMQNHIQGKVIIRFVVSKTGQVSRVEVVRSLFPECDDEAVRVVKLLPNFIPGSQNGKNVAVWYLVPVNFRLQ